MIESSEIDPKQEFERKVRDAFQIQDPDQAFIDRLQQHLVERHKVIKQRAERRRNWLAKVRQQLSPLAWGVIAIILILALVWGIKNLIPNPEPSGIYEVAPTMLVSPPTPLESTAFPPEVDIIGSIDLPDGVGIPVSWPEEAITPENVAKITRLSLWSRGVINGAAWSPDGQTVAIASSTGVYLYDALSFEQLDTIAVGSNVHHIAYAPDGSMLAVFHGFHEGNYVTLFYVASKESLSPVSIQTVGPSDNIAFSTDGRLMAFGYDESTIKIWDTTSSEELNFITGAFDSIRKLIFYNNGATLVSLLRPVTYTSGRTARYNGDPSIHDVVIWDVNTGKMVRSLDNCRGTNMALNPDNQTVVVNRGNYISICDLESGALISKQKIGAINPITYSSDGKLMAGVMGSEIKVWDVTAGEELITLSGMVKELSSMAFSPDGSRLVTVSDGLVMFWDINGGEVLFTISGYKGIGSTEPPDPLEKFRERVIDIEFSPDGQILATVSEEGPVTLFSINTGKIIAEFETDVGSVWCIAFSPDGKLLAAGGGKYEPLVSSVQIWDVATQEQRLKLDGFQESVLSIAFSPDGSMLATGEGNGYGNAGSTKIWDLSSGKLFHEFGVKISANPLKYWTAYDVAYNPDGTLVAVAASEGGVLIWDVVNQEQIARLDFDNFVNGVAFSPDGNLLAVAGQSGEGYINYASDIRLWDIATRQVLFTIEGQDLARDIVFSPDGRILASASLDGRVWLWDVSTGKPLVTLYHSGAETIAFSPDGKLLATGGDTVNLWGIPPSDISPPD